MSRFSVSLVHLPMALVHAARVHLKLARKKMFARGSEVGLLFCAILVGVAAGVAVSGMSWVSRTLHSLIYGIAYTDWLSASVIENKTLLLIGPAAGGALLGIVLLALKKWRNRPIVDPIEANALYGGHLSLTDSLIVTVQNLISNGFGASVGLEAGYTQLASGIASKIGSKLHLRREDMRILVGCGAAGAISGAFAAPLTGAFYAFELIIGTYSVVALAPVVVAALLGNIVARTLSGDTFLIEVGDIGVIAPHDYLPAIVLGALCGVVGIGIMQAVSWTEQIARRSSIPAYVRPALGGLVVGLLAMVTPQVLSAGHGGLHLNLATEPGLQALIILFVLKSAASAISIGSGFRGGLFFASLFMGSLLGKVFSYPADMVMIGALTPTIFAVVGMSSLAVAIIGGPMAMTFLALEITGDFPIAALVLAAVISSSLVVRMTFGYSFATWRFHLRGEGIRGAHDVGWIKTLTVGRMMRADVRTALNTLSLKAFREAFPLGSAQRATIIDAEGRYVGMILIPDVYGAEAAHDETMSLDPFLRHRDDFLLPGMNAREAAAAFDRTLSEALAVVNNPVERLVIGQLSESHTLRRYSEELDRRRREATGEL